MTGLSIGFVLGSTLLFSAVFQVNAQAVTNGAACNKKFKTGTETFVLDTQDAVNAGATFISSPTVTNADDCVNACCQIPQCNLALIENGQETGSVKTCFLFNCLYRNEYVCRFVNNVGFTNYIPETVYEQHLGGHGSEKESPIANAGLDIVVQPNDWVSLNGVESKAKGDKVISKFEWSLQEGDASVVIHKTGLADQVQLSDLKPGVYEFQLKVTDSKGLSDTAQVTVLVLTPEQSDHQCLVPKKVGPCRGSFPRWHYNAASEECEEFTYGGCRGNHNNYISEPECTVACKGVQVDATGRIGPLPTEVEVCGVPCKPWQFVCNSGCCLSKALECDAVAHCTDGSDEASCYRLNETFSRLLNVDVDHKKVRCTEPPKTGPCRASHTRWYYDPLNRKCYRFTFGGCEGNDNNFEQEDTCSSTCDGVTDKHVFARGMFDYQADEGTESASIAIAILLALAILAVLAVLGYCFLKKRKDRTQHQPVTTHVPFEDRDTMVYNSTTKPV
ncbi:kunitz-type protease inhibitor 1b isoform X1 [Osmerus mordax]|uniref:kunitz-type protease inhibitor 1b isoform X1 n=1 Tax=Osmerus mordax TaxID=8014 RepID=UPI00350F6B0D